MYACVSKYLYYWEISDPLRTLVYVCVKIKCYVHIMCVFGKYYLDLYYKRVCVVVEINVVHYKISHVFRPLITILRFVFCVSER